MKKTVLVVVVSIFLSFNGKTQAHHNSSSESQPLTITAKAASAVGGGTPLPAANVDIQGEANVCDFKWPINSDCATNANKFTYILIVPAGAYGITNNWTISGGLAHLCWSSTYNTTAVFSSNNCAIYTAKINAKGSYKIQVYDSYLKKYVEEIKPIDFTKNITVTIMDHTITPASAWKLDPKYYDQTPIVYSINPVCGATNYKWNIPFGWHTENNTPLSGANLTSIKVIPDGSNGGNISVTASNSCKSIIYQKSISRPKEQPVFTMTQASQCLINNQSQVFTTNTVPNVSSYLWSCPVGWSWSVSIPTQPSATVNFNNVAQKASVCVQSVFPDGEKSLPKCYLYTTFSEDPKMVDLETFEDGTYSSTGFRFFTTDNSFIETSTSLPTSSTVWTNRGTEWFWNVIAPRTYTYWIRTKNDCGISPSERWYLSVQPGGSLRSSLDKSSLATKSISDETHEIVLFPNPSNGQIQLNYTLEKEEQGELQITDMLGKNVATYELNEKENSLSINKTELNDGMYLYRVLINGELVKTDKIYIVH
jgi:hypothetical protein